MKFDSPYNPKEVEEKIYKLWEKSGFFNPDKLPKRYKLKAKSYSVMMAPPNITGTLHLGHALENTIIDILVRMKRMQGFKTLWLPGIDHAGIATQNVVEKELRKNGLRRQDLGREKFIEKTKEWKEKYGTIILDQLKKLGISPDWSRTRYTLDPNYTKAVQTAFAHYYDKGWIYRGERVINWCPRCETGISDLEVEYREEKSKLYYIKYPLAPRQARGDNDYIVVATTRPETMLGDTAVAVGPKDSRYKKLVGKFAVLPIQNRKIPIIADIAVDPKFGTGAVKVTPAHDVADFEISLRHNLPKSQIIDERGAMTKEAGLVCAGLKADDCRLKIIGELQKLGLLQKIEDYTHNIAYCERCGSKIEPRLSKQWFLKMGKLAQSAIKAVKNKETIITPKKWEKVLIDRLKNERDWNISRQLWWGHKIPIEGETDVLDTWFSSALWPFATLGWPLDAGHSAELSRSPRGKPQKNNDLKTYYPTDYVTSAREILNIWIAKMIFSGKEFMGKTPFKVAHIHATILTEDGKRMSKSLGTGIDPMLLIDKYGADATRFGLIWQCMGGQDIHWSEEHVVAGKKFCNKIWNASRFVLLQIGNNKPPASAKASAGKQTLADKKILLGLKKLQKDVEKNIEKYEFGKALHRLYDFFWHRYADIYIETAKKQPANVLLYVHLNLLKLLHPFLPFITEEIWSAFNNKNMMMIEDWPK